MITQLLVTALLIYQIIIIARILMSWFPLDRNNQTINTLVTFIFNATEPVLKPIRDLLPPLPLDFSPMIVILIISLLTRLIS